MSTVLGIPASHAACVSNLLSKPRSRVRSREKSRILIGNRSPVISSVVTPNATAPVVTDNIQYLDVGLKLEVEPLVRMASTLSIKLHLEVSTLRDSVTTRNGCVALRVGTRTANTVLQIRDGETQTLMGLIQDDEVVLTIIPRIVRGVPRPSLDMAALCSGTLIELLVVMAMIATIASIAASRYFKSLDKAKKTALKSNPKVMRGAIGRYHEDNGRWPATLDDLVKARFLREIPKDTVTDEATTWVVTQSRDGSSPGVVDVHSGAPANARDGTAYERW
jgi:type II secretory pathway pseudopilin PulG